MSGGPEVRSKERPIELGKRKAPKGAAGVIWAESTFKKRSAHFLDRSHAAELWEGQREGRTGQ